MLNIIPPPAELHLTGKKFRPSTLSVRKICSPGLKSEEYGLEISENKILLRYSAPAGLRYARQTLNQIRKLCPDGLPGLVIHDAPAFARRGVMLDVSRGRVWTMRHFKETIRKLARWKYNLLQLYFESAYASPGNEEIWTGMSPVTPSELKELEIYAATYGIELSVCQNCFGHLTRFLIHPKYRHLAEIQPGMVYEAWGRMSAVPQTLAPGNPESVQFVRRLLNSYFIACRSPHVNLGCDETLDLGFGVSRGEAGKKGLSAIFADYVGKLCTAVSEAGRRPMIWADFPMKHPDVIELLPKHLVYLLWGYDADTPFRSWCETIRSSGNEFWVCPGSCSWSSLFGNVARRQANMRKAAEDGLAGGASGYLLTDWGDGGHRQCWGPSLAAIAEGACFAWSGPVELNRDAIAGEAFGSIAAGQWYDRAGHVEDDLAAVGLPGLYADLHIPWHQIPEKQQTSDAAAYQALIPRLEKLHRDVPADVSSLLQREMRMAAGFAIFAAERAVLRREGRALELKSLAVRMAPLIREFQRLWLRRSRPGGLTWSSAQWRKIADEMDNIC
ncbi:MAG: hypothetical protein E7055_04610 [Lentisphaerae bacterium]|nr:hypothetical protein [Lentisphaerota bacterium]